MEPKKKLDGKKDSLDIVDGLLAVIIIMTLVIVILFTVYRHYYKKAITDNNNKHNQIIELEKSKNRLLEELERQRQPTLPD